MLKLFGRGGLHCPRCDHLCARDAVYCEQCANSLRSQTFVPVPMSNRWMPAKDELAWLIENTQLQALFEKYAEVHIPITARAYLVGANDATELMVGRYTEALLMQQLAFFSPTGDSSTKGDIFITSQAASSLQLTLEDLYTVEFLKLTLQCSCSVKVGAAFAFAHHFMRGAGRLVLADLQDQLLPALRQFSAEFIGTRSLREMAGNLQLQQQLAQHLQVALSTHFVDYGLVFEQFSILNLRHDKLGAGHDALGEQRARHWLIADGQQEQLEQAKRLQTLYSAEEWQKIELESEQIRLRFTREEMRQQFGQDLARLYLRTDYSKARGRLTRAKLAQDEAERLQTIRESELELYARTVDAKSRKQACERGAGEAQKTLSHQESKKALERIHESAVWENERRLAQINMRTASEIKQFENKASLQMLQQEHVHQLQQAKLQNELQSLELKQKTEAVKRGIEDADGLAQHEKLLRTLDVNTMYELQLLQQRKQARLNELDADEKRLQLKLQEENAQWLWATKTLAVQSAEKLDLQKLEHERLLAEQSQVALLQRIAIDRLTTIASFSETAKVATADTANAALLVDMLKLQTHASMSAEQILATEKIAANVTRQNGMSLEQAFSLAREQLREERDYRDKESALMRRHQVDLTMAQNNVQPTPSASRK
ncbi:MAG: hypothetical protein K2P84_07615 [Undibacterium sp.]|nr:hypothetical protein [Undibacterium sp.]